MHEAHLIHDLVQQVEGRGDSEGLEQAGAFGRPQPVAHHRRRSAHEPALLRSTDGGQTWKAVRTE
jgi:hypothetical protein